MAQRHRSPSARREGPAFFVPLPPTGAYIVLRYVLQAARRRWELQVRQQRARRA